MIIILFWIIVILLIVLIGLGLYFFPAITLKILSDIVKVLILGTFFLAKAVVKSVRCVSKKFKDYIEKRKLNKRQNENSQVEESSNSTINNVTNVNIKGSRLFSEEDSLTSDLDTKVDDSNLIKKGSLFTR